MNSGWRRNSAGVAVPAEQRAKAEVLDNREFGEHFSVIHFDHTLVDLGPASLDTRNIIQHLTVLPEWPFLHIVYEADGGEIHVDFPLFLYNVRFRDTVRVYRIW